MAATSDAATSLSVIGVAASAFAIKSWPDGTTVDDSFGIWPVVWILTGAGISILGLIGLLVPALVTFAKSPSWPRLGFAMVGLFVIITGVITLLKWHAVQPLGHGP